MNRCNVCGSLTKPSVSCPCQGAEPKKIWDKIRPIVKPWFVKAGFDKYCELGCGREGQGFAHTKKQRWLTESEMYVVAYLCNDCHNRIEGHVLMEQIILDIRSRNKIPEIDRKINEYHRTKIGTS